MAASCEYTIGGKTFTEKEFKEYLLAGGLKSLIEDGDVKLPESVATTFSATVKDEQASEEDAKSEEGNNAGGEEYIGITHTQMNELAEELGFPKYEENPETIEQWDVEAEKRYKAGGMPAVIAKLQKTEMPTAVEQRMMLLHIATLKSQVNENPTNEKLKELKDAIELSNLIGGREVGKSLAARKGNTIVRETLADEYVYNMVELGQDELTEGQKKAIEAEWNRVRKAEKAMEEYYRKREEALTMKEAGMAVEDMKKTKRPSTKLKSLNEERQQIISDILMKARNAGKNGVSFLGANEIASIAPDVLKLAKNLVETGVVGLKELTGIIHDSLKKDLPDLEESQIREIIAGKHTKKKPTKTELAIKWRDITDQARLIEQLEALESGQEPKSEKKKIERIQQITDLRKQIKEHYLTNLSATKSRMEAELKKIEQQLESGDFSRPEKKDIVLDAEGKQIQKELLEARKERDIRLEKQKYEKRTSKQKAIDKFIEIMNVPRSLMASMDYSAPLNQSIVATIAYPSLAKEAAKQMFRSSISQTEFDQWFYDLKDSPRYDLMKELKLKISDPHSPYLVAREEAFMSGYAEQIPLAGRLVKGSERAYVQYLNKMRVDLFNMFVNRFEDSGKTYKNNKKLYEKTARFINNITGAGVFGKLDQFAPILNSLFFSPRLIASRFNLLNPYYFLTLPGVLKKEYIKSMGKFALLGNAVLGAMSAYSKSQDDDDPNKIHIEWDRRSADFGKIRQGDTRWNFWGGFQPYVALAGKFTSGQSKSSTSGVVRDIDGEDMYDPSTGNMLLRFLRGKLAPVPGAAIDIVTGEKVTGEKVTVGNELKSLFIPFLAQAVAEGWKDYGAMSLLNIGLPSVFGVGTQTYEPRKREVKDEITIRVRKGGGIEEMKVKLNDEQLEKYKSLAEKYTDEYVKKMKSVPGYEDLSAEEKQNQKRNTENAAVRKAKEEIIKKYRTSLEKNAQPKGKSEKAKRVEAEFKKRINK